MIKYTIELKPAKGFEKIISNYTYMNFIEILKAQCSALGFRYKIKKGGQNIARSDNWGEE